MGRVKWVLAMLEWELMPWWEWRCMPEKFAVKKHPEHQ